MKRIRQKVRDKTQRGRCHADLREVIAILNPILRGWGAYFGTGNAARSFNQIDTNDCADSASSVRVGSSSPAPSSNGIGDYFVGLGLHRLRGTVQYPEATQYRWHESPPASRVREIRTHGLYGGRMETRLVDEGK